MKRKAKCLVCGAMFTADRITQKYCSAFCRRYAHRYGLIDRGEHPKGADVVREFHCVRCGTLVTIVDGRDKRTKFCSAHCERLYWKHSQHVKPHGVARSFYCRNCGVRVDVSDPKDRRTSFCREACRKQWFSQHRKKKTRHI